MDKEKIKALLWKWRPPLSSEMVEEIAAAVLQLVKKEEEGK